MEIEFKLPDIVIVFAPKVSVAPDDLFTVIVALTAIVLAPPTEALSAPVKFSGTPISKVPLLIRLPLSVSEVSEPLEISKVPLLIRLPLSVSEPLDPPTIPPFATVSERMVTSELIVRVVPESTTKLSSPSVKTFGEGSLPPVPDGLSVQAVVTAKFEEGTSVLEYHVVWALVCSAQKKNKAKKMVTGF